MTTMTHAVSGVAGVAGARTGRAPVLLREGISWSGGVQRRPLRVHLRLHNPHPEATRPVQATIQVAEFGLFRPWAPLTRIAVPPIPPGGRLIATGTADGDEQRRLITAAAPVMPRLSRASAMRVAQVVRRAAGSLLSGSLWEAPAESLHFVGNLNVFVDEHAPLERHMAMWAGIRAGHVNLGLFKVGNAKADHYTFGLDEAPPGWQVELAPVAFGVETPMHFATVYALIAPPPRAECGRVAISVFQRSTGTTGLVEFELETTRRGSRGYFLGT